MPSPARSATDPVDLEAGGTPVMLSTLRPGERGVVHGLRFPQGQQDHNRQLLMRLLEIGFVEGEPVQVTALGPGGREPLAVRIGDTLFALRRYEAEHVLVQRSGGHP